MRCDVVYRGYVNDNIWYIHRTRLTLYYIHLLQIGPDVPGHLRWLLVRGVGS